MLINKIDGYHFVVGAKPDGKLKDAAAGRHNRMGLAELMLAPEAFCPIGPLGEKGDGEHLPTVGVTAQHQIGVIGRGFIDSQGIVIHHDERAIVRVAGSDQGKGASAVGFADRKGVI